MGKQAGGAPLIELNEVCFSVRNENIIKKFSYQFMAGEANALTGSTGSGKSTVLKLAAALLVPDSGRVRYRGKNIAAMNRKANLQFRRECGFVFQDSALWANQTIYQALDLPLRVHFPEMEEAERKRAIEDALALVGYAKEAHVRPERLSMGEQKLIAFARAIICKPQTLFLDEWTESLDESSALRLLEIIKKYKEERRTIIFVSHNAQIVRTLADFVLIMDNGGLSRVIESAGMTGEAWSAEIGMDDAF
jgi:ABC-type lipoprotein export system ATPase subunit